MSDATASTVNMARLLSLAVHELRTPASVVGGYLRMLARDTDPALGDRQRKMVDEAEKACARMVAIVSELSEVAAIDAGAAVFSDEPLDVFQLAADVARDTHEAEERGVGLRVAGDADGAVLAGDRVRLTAAFSAFFRAVLREQPAPATIAVTRRIVSERGSKAAMILIARAQDVEQSLSAPAGAFDELRGGLGLALPRARRIVERHGGRVWTPELGNADASSARSAIAILLPLSRRQA